MSVATSLCKGGSQTTELLAKYVLPCNINIYILFSVQVSIDALCSD